MSADVIALIGPNVYQLEQKEKSIRNDFVKNYSSLAMQIIDGEDIEFESLNEALISTPFLSPKKLVIAKRLSSNKKITDKIELLLKNQNENTIFLIVEPKIDKRGTYYKALKKLTSIEEFKDLDSLGLAKWITAEVKNKKGNISLADANYLIDRVGPNQLMLSSEISKLLLNNHTIDKRLIDKLTDPSPSGTTFNLLDAAFAGNYKKTIELYDSQRKQNIEPSKILGMIVWQLNIVALVSSSKKSAKEISSDSGIHPFVIEKSLSIAKRIPKAKLKKLLDTLCEIDFNLKSQKINADEVLKQFLLELA